MCLCGYPGHQVFQYLTEQTSKLTSSNIDERKLADNHSKDMQIVNAIKLTEIAEITSTKSRA